MKCNACERLCRSRSCIVEPTPARLRAGALLCIGEAPGAAEDRAGEGFVGASGLVLRRALAAEGLDIEWQVGFANVVRCRPPGNAAPTSEEISSCLPRLAQTLPDLQPRALLLVGNTATQAFLGKGSLSEHIRRHAAGQDTKHRVSSSHAALREALERLLTRPEGLAVVPMPHTSGLAWNRPSSFPGLRWRDVGAMQIRMAIRALEGSSAQSHPLQEENAHA